MREGGRRGRDRGAQEGGHHEAILGARALEEPARRAPRDRYPLRYPAPAPNLTADTTSTMHGATTSPWQAREKLYLLAVGHYRNGDYIRSRQFPDHCLELVASSITSLDVGAVQLTLSGTMHD